MSKFWTIAALAAILAGAASAGPIERACNKSERGAGKRQLCGCIQQVADITLTRRDQRMAARFFADPHESQVVRQSDRNEHESFWRKYKAFGSAAQNYCS